MFRFKNLKEEGIFKYFFHHPKSRFPIRDLEQGKTEPHIEKNAENFRACCYQGRIVAYLKSDRRYLFWIAQCRNPSSANFKRFAVVGYLVKTREIRRDDHWAVQGDVHLYSFKDAYYMDKLRPTQFYTNPRHISYPTAAETALLLAHFKTKRNIKNECIDELKRLQKPKGGTSKSRC